MVAIHRPPPLQKPDPSFATLVKGTQLLRLYNTKSPFPFSLFRFFGPLERYDHHREEFRWKNKPDPERAVCYCAETMSACIVEVFGDNRIITAYYNIVTIELTHNISLLDIRGRAAMKAGIPMALSAIPDRIYTQEWARYFFLETSIYGLDTGGMIYPSAHNGEDCIVLWNRARAYVQAVGQRPIIEKEKQVRKIAEKNSLIVTF